DTSQGTRRYGISDTSLRALGPVRGPRRRADRPGLRWQYTPCAIGSSPGRAYPFPPKRPQETALRSHGAPTSRQTADRRRASDKGAATWFAASSWPRLCSTRTNERLGDTLPWWWSQ